MSLTLYYHPLASFCWKALIGLYELGVPFEKHLVDLGNDEARAAFTRVWPIAKFPVLRDHARGLTVPESSILLEYADRLATVAGAGASADAGAKTPRLIPRDPDRALECRLRDRVYDAYVHQPMQTIVGDRIRPADQRDPYGVARARTQLETAYALVESEIGDGPWALGREFSLADCAAMPALYYGDKVVPLGDRWPKVAAYLERLSRRPSVARVLAEAAPYFSMFPGED
jgi:glutathione S-transferase